MRLSALLMLLLGVAVSGCGPNAAEDAANDDEPLYLTTTPPLEFILDEVVGERGHVERLLAGSSSPHTHDPRPSNARAAARSTALFYGAPSLDAWAAGLEAAHTVSLLELVPDSALLRLPGRDEIDPHFWLDPLAVRALLPALSDTLCTLDASGCDGYRTRVRIFDDRLGELHRELSATLAPLQGQAVMLAHPFLSYFARRYGLDVAAVVEPSAGAEPSPRRVRQLIEQVHTDDVHAVVTMPQHSSRAAQAVADEAGVPVVELDPLGGVAGRDTYTELLRYNARRLVEAAR